MGGDSRHGVRAINARTGRVFLDDLREARGPWQQFIGLMFRRTLADDRGLRFRPARGIHTHFMRFPIDLVYLDEADRVHAIREAVPPWRFDFRRAAAVIEANAGAANRADLKIGDRIIIDAG